MILLSALHWDFISCQFIPRLEFLRCSKRATKLLNNILFFSVTEFVLSRCAVICTLFPRARGWGTVASRSSVRW